MCISQAFKSELTSVIHDRHDLMLQRNVAPKRYSTQNNTNWLLGAAKLGSRGLNLTRATERAEGPTETNDVASRTDRPCVHGPIAAATRPTRQSETTTVLGRGGPWRGGASRGGGCAARAAATNPTGLGEARHQCPTRGPIAPIHNQGEVSTRVPTKSRGEIESHPIR